MEFFAMDSQAQATGQNMPLGEENSDVLIHDF